MSRSTSDGKHLLPLLGESRRQIFCACPGADAAQIAERRQAAGPSFARARSSTADEHSWTDMRSTLRALFPTPSRLSGGCL
eukprot:CAMPEP_0195066784 /NCGR_PEP_ID=MMETSP0448-20130528/12039_1 /TAXON_ID=66468 /ORGANISM="Heterocapsa triquestra, Strain CCMP 448" /LENGTH=80 /DNA_ID=CAMNT_0040098091 /DNA_START=131 /DNA_END=370 /DNA_ORIENTATION=+